MFTAAIMLTDTVCNGNCSYCYAGYNNHKPIRKFEPDLEKFKAVLKEFYEIDRYNVGEKAHFEIWGGEVTINPWLVPTCNAINEVFKEYNITPSITVVTNGYDIKKAYGTTPSNVKFQISNDMCYQTLNRGKQPMEDEEWSHMIKDMYDNNRLSGFQSVITPENSDVLSLYHYFLDWELKYNIDTTLGFMVCKSYGVEGTEHLFNKYNCDTLCSSVLEVFKEIMKHMNEGKNYKVDERLLNRSFFPSLPQFIDPSGYGGRVHYPCQTFSRKSCIAINGERYSCPHDFELGLTSAESLKRYEELYERCATCTFRWLCKGICAGATREEKIKNCENLWIFYSSFRRALLAYMPLSEMEKIEDAEIIQSYKY